MQCGSARHLPSSGANCAPGSARCWAGSGHCIRAPTGEQGGIIRSDSSPQGVRPVFLQPSRRSVGWSSFRPCSAVCAALPAAGRGAETLRSKRSPVGALFPLQPEHLLHGHSRKRQRGFYGDQSTSGGNGTGVRALRVPLTWDFMDEACDIDHIPPGRRGLIR